MHPSCSIVLFVALLPLGTLVQDLFLRVVEAANPIPDDFIITMNPQRLTLQNSTTGIVTLTVSRQGGFAGTVLASQDPNVKCGVSANALCASVDPGAVTLRRGTYANFLVVVPTTHNTPSGLTTIRVNATNTNANTGISIRHSVDIMVNVVPARVPDYGVYTPSGGLPVIRVSPTSSGSSQFRIASFNNFAGAIVLASSSTSQGLVATINPSQALLTAGHTITATVNVTVSPSQSFGSSLLFVSGNSSSATRLTVFSIHVLPYYNMTLDPSRLTITPGASATAALTIVTNGFPNTLSCNVTAREYGLTAQLDPSDFTVSKTTKVAKATLIVSAISSVNPGSYNIDLTSKVANVSASDRTSTTKKLTLPVTVTASPTTGRRNNDTNTTNTTPANPNSLLS